MSVGYLLIGFVLFIAIFAGGGALITGQVQIPWDTVWAIVKWGGSGVLGLWVFNMVSQILPTIEAPEPYIPPERSPNGSFIGYRYFIKGKDGKYFAVTQQGMNGFNRRTGRLKGEYVDGWNQSDQPPTTNNKNGIYAAKRHDSPILEGYDQPGRVLAKVELWGKVVEGAEGFRAQYCRILETYEGDNDGHWQSDHYPR